MAQSPTIAIPRKKTEDVDWTGPIRSIIAHSYGESPDNYAAECAALQRCRQDAVKGAGSDMTGRDLLYKYFGQLELLELRFSEIKVQFPWHDAFTSKLTTQTSLAFEKASIIFQIASTHSSIASSQNRSDPEGLKRAFHYFKTSAGMLTYINENFLHAPSTDLSREVVKFLVGVMLAQATEVFFEKLVDEKKSNAMIAKVASQTSYNYTNLSEEVKEFMGKGIFDRNWVTLIQLKAKYFTSLSQYYRSLVDSAAGNHGEALTRLVVAETLAKDTNRSASSFSSYFVSTLSPSLPPDAGTSMLEISKAHLALMTEKKNEAQRDNDLIYNAVCPSESTLPAIDKLSVANPIPIQDVYSGPDVQKVIGPDMFVRLVPLSVHESASVYSEEKAKLVRGEVEKAEIADGEARVALESLGLPAGLRKWKELANGEEDIGVPREVDMWANEVRTTDGGVQGVERKLAELEKVKKGVDDELQSVSRELEVESRECEAMRVKYEHHWDQEPSAGPNRPLRQDMKSHRDAFTAASSSDSQISSLWTSIRSDLMLLLSGSETLERYFAAETAAASGQSEPSLLDFSDDLARQDRQGLEDIKRRVDEIEERMGRVNKIKRERAEVLKDLKEKIQNDDVSHLLLLNRRQPNVETGLFAQELEKFKPYQNRLAATVLIQGQTVDEIAGLWKTLISGGQGKDWIKKADLKEKRRIDAIARLSKARDGWMEVREAIGKGLQFYRDLSELTNVLRRNVSSFVNTRASERDKLIAKAVAANTSSNAASAPPPPQPSKPSLNNAMSSLSLSTPASGTPLAGKPPASPWHQALATSSPPPPPPPSVPLSPNMMRPPPPTMPPPPNPGMFPPPPPQPLRMGSFPQPPPPPPTAISPSTSIGNPYASLSLFDAIANAAQKPSAPSAPSFGTYNTAPQPPQQQPQQPQYPSYPGSMQSPSAPPPQQPQHYGYGYQGFPPPPPSATQQQPQQQQQPQAYPAYQPPPNPAPPQQQQFGQQQPPSQYPYPFPPPPSSQGSTPYGAGGGYQYNR